jgi:hypothetical protein
MALTLKMGDEGITLYLLDTLNQVQDPPVCIGSLR